MLESPLVSVLTTAYNREKYIAEAIESVLASTYRNFELIIVDDCSKDKTVEIAIEYEKRDSRVKVYKNERNLGDYPNRNKAASYATGKYIKYLDADDIIYPHGLEAMVYAMEKFPECSFGTQFFEREYDQPYPILIDSRKAFYEYFFGRSYFQSGPTGTIFKRETFIKLGCFTGQRYIGDTEMWIKFSLSGPIVLFQPALIWWRKHEGQEFQLGQTNDGYLKMNHTLFIETIKNERLPLNKEEKEKAIFLYRKSVTRLFVGEILKRRNFKKAIFIYKNCNISMSQIFFNK